MFELTTKPPIPSAISTIDCIAEEGSRTTIDKLAFLITIRSALIPVDSELEPAEKSPSYTFSDISIRGASAAVMGNPILSSAS